jgi:predicted dithiol-disulfide oxidoreductase (DUF899 family)
MEHLRYPNESVDYRTARNVLLDAEIALRREIERVAAMRRALPPGGTVPTDYVFERLGANLMPEPVKLSELFGNHRSILLYSFMYGPDREDPCPGCTHLLDGVNGAALHAGRRLPIHVVSRSPLARMVALAKGRGWDNLILLSAERNSYTSDYFGNTAGLNDAMRIERNHDRSKNFDEPMANVFVKDDGAVRHFWGSELVFAPEEEGQNHRALDLIDPVWNLLDLAPEGRGSFFPRLSYD